MSTLAQQMFPGAPIEVAERAYSEASTAAAPGAVNVALAAGWGGGACNLVSAGALPAGLTYLEALVLVNAPATGLLPAEQVVFRRHALALQAAAGDPVLTADPASEDKDSAVAVKATGAIIMPEATLLADGDVVHVADPNSSTNYKINKTGTLFDPASTMINISGKSVGTIDTVAVASISNGQNLVLTDGVHAASTFDADVDGLLVSSNTHVPLSGKARGDITALATASLNDGETFTIPDGAHTAPVITVDKSGAVFVDFGSTIAADIASAKLLKLSGAAKGGILAAAVGPGGVANGNGFKLWDAGAAGLIPFFFDVDGTASFAGYPVLLSGKARGMLECHAAPGWNDGEKVTLPDGVHTATQIFLDVTGGYFNDTWPVVELSGKSKASATFVAKASAALSTKSVGDVTVLDGAGLDSVTELTQFTWGTETFFYGLTVGGTRVAGPNEHKIGFAVADDLATIKAATINKVNTDAVGVTASSGAPGVVTLTDDKSGTAGNGKLASSTLTFTQMATAVDGAALTVNDGAATKVYRLSNSAVYGTDVQIDTSAATDDASMATAAKTAIDLQGQAVVVATPGAGVARFTASSVGVLGTKALSASGTGITATTFAGGLAAAITSEIDVAAAIAATSNAVGATLALTAVAPGDNTIEFTNNALGVAGNVAITSTSGGVTVSVGMIGGAAAASTAAADVATAIATWIPFANTAGATHTLVPAVYGSAGEKVGIYDSVPGAGGNHAISDVTGVTATGLGGGGAALATNAEVATALGAAVTALGVGVVNITPQVVANKVYLTNNVAGIAGNQTIGTTTSCGKNNMTGGEAAPVTDVEVAAHYATAINGKLAGLAITAAQVAGTRRVNLTNDAIGAYNAGITTTTTFTVAGMSTGTAAAATTGTAVALLLSDAINADAGIDIASTPSGASLALLADATGYTGDQPITTTNPAITVSGMSLGSTKMTLAFGVVGGLVALQLDNLPNAAMNIIYQTTPMWTAFP